ncbi:hypothetical protein E4V51_22465, partial [Paenibacillus sp. 28ISP30-2]|nr:hypothetical protein [Paenibacillus sp. 28ISP30-2]
MPELPEVETIKRTLNELIVDKHIDHVTVNLPPIFRGPEDIHALVLNWLVLRDRKRHRLTPSHVSGIR